MPNLTKVSFDSLQWQQSSVIIKSTARGYPLHNINSSVIGSQGNSNNTSSMYNGLDIENICIVVPPSDSLGGPTIGGIVGRYLGQLIAKNILMGVDTPINKCLYPQTTGTSDSESSVIGISGPLLNTDDHDFTSLIENCFVYGMHQGFTLRSASANNIRAVACWQGITSNLSKNFTIVNRATVEYCPYSISGIRHPTVNTVLLSAIKITSVHINWARTGKWFDNRYVASDPYNYGVGVVTYEIDSANAIHNEIFKKEGGSKWQCDSLGTHFLTSIDVPKTGTSIQNGDGSTKTFHILHGLGSSPAYISVQPGTLDCNSIMYIDADATNINVYYYMAPIIGTNNIKYYWSAR